MERVVQVPEVVLNSGHKMPVLGFGTAAKPLPSPYELVAIILNAIEVGYRHFDTAALYGTEESVGRAVAEALERGLIKRREEVFITSKLWCTDAHPDLVLPALEETLGKLGLDYVDLYLVHWPVRIRKGVFPLQNFTKDDLLPFDTKGTWEAMEKCHQLGLAKSIGISNFSCAKISKLLQHATIPPAVNQVEMHAVWQQQKMLRFCKERGIHVSAWSPLGANGTEWGSDVVMENPVLKAIGVVKKKSVAQIALRWIHEQGAIIIVKSFNKDRMKRNLQIFDWQLTEDEVHQIQEIPQKRGYIGDCYVDPNVPIKSIEHLWDGEL